MNTIMKDQTELAPCPFCGGQALSYQALVNWFVVRCSNIECALWVNTVPLHQWNSRHDLRRIKELEDFLGYVLEISSGQASRIKEMEANVKDLEARTSKPWSDPL